MRQGSLPGRAETPQGAPSRSDRARSPRSGESPAVSFRSDDLFEKAVDMRKRAQTFRRLGLLASASALDERADRLEWRADYIRAEERAEAGRALGLSQFSQVSRRP